MCKNGHSETNTSGHASANNAKTDAKIEWALEVFYKKMVNPASLSFIFGLFKNALLFLQQINVKNVHPIYSAGIWTHDLSNMSRLP